MARTDMAKTGNIYSLSFVTFLSILVLSGCETTTESHSTSTPIEEVSRTKAKAESGDVQAQLKMASIARWRHEDMDEAIKWYSKAVEQGDLSAAVSLGEIYLEGLQGVPKDTDEAVKLYAMAAERGDTFTSRNLGDIYFSGEHIPKDLDKAEKWYRLAIEQGDIYIQRRLEKTIKEKDPVAWAQKEQELIEKKEERQRELEEKNRLKAEARAREKATEQKRLAVEKAQLRQARLATIRDQYGQQIGLAVIPLSRDIKLEKPQRKKPKPKDGGSGGDGTGEVLGYLLPTPGTGVLVGILAGALVLDAISSGGKTRLSDVEKKEIEAAAESLKEILTPQTVEQRLQEHIIESGKVPSGESLYIPVDFQAPDLGLSRYQRIQNSDVVVEVETLGVGLMLSEKQYRPAQFLISNEVRVRNISNGEVADRKSFCYASGTHNFSFWGADDGKRLREEMESTYSRTAEDIQLMLAGKLADASKDEQRLCAALNEKASQYRHKR